jgi:NAD(P)-dependent dehydrogenase (short-subunit alcohol dehydrogenase family)
MRLSTALKIALGALALGGLGAGAAQLALRPRRYDFTGKVAVVTGGSRGLGLAIARVLKERGARVALVARDDEELERARLRLRGDGGGIEVLAVRCDVSSPTQVERAVAQVIEVFGRIDVLVNDAGTIEVGPFESMALQDFDTAMATNFWGALHFVRAVRGPMLDAGGGRILNVSSVGGAVAVPHLLPYVASKFALTGLSLGLRAELAKDRILVTTACPGLMRTGSAPHAFFKGNRVAEYRWFAIADALPIVSSSMGHAVRRVVRALEQGRAFVTVTPAARIGILAQALAPELTSLAMRAVHGLLPRGQDASPASQGFEARRRVAS